MTIIVDELRTYQTEAIKPAARKHGHAWCHMTSDANDGYVELHAFAERLGLRGDYFQGNHYDLTPNKRAQALRMGATFVPALSGVFSREHASVLAEPEEWLKLKALIAQGQIKMEQERFLFGASDARAIMEKNDDRT